MFTIHASYAGGPKYLHSATSTAITVLAFGPPLQIVGRGTENGKKVTYSWKGMTGSGIVGFDIIARGAKHPKVEENKTTIKAHPARLHILRSQRYLGRG